MDSDKYRVKFEEEVERVKHPLHGRQDLAIWGGTCPEGALADFLAGWSLEKMPYRIWESTDRIDFERDSSAPNVALLERGRIFGEGGDLDLRRDGNAFRWHFVGAHDVRPPQEYDTDEANFWEQHSDAAFHCYEKTVLLWGERKGERWHDDRVAAAELIYPVLDNAERVQVQYKVYSRDGHVEFVWLIELREWKEDDNG